MLGLKACASTARQESFIDWQERNTLVVIPSAPSRAGRLLPGALLRRTYTLFCLTWGRTALQRLSPLTLALSQTSSVRTSKNLSTRSSRSYRRRKQTDGGRKKAKKHAGGGREGGHVQSTKTSYRLGMCRGLKKVRF